MSILQALSRNQSENDINERSESLSENTILVARPPVNPKSRKFHEKGIPVDSY